jgi:hypothetical protein
VVASNLYVQLLQIVNSVLNASFRPCVGIIQRNLHHTFTIVVHFDLMMNQIMLIWKEYLVTFLSVKVWLYFPLKVISFSFYVHSYIFARHVFWSRAANLFESPFYFFIFGMFVWNLDRIALVFHLLIALFGVCTGFQFDYVFDWTILIDDEPGPVQNWRREQGCLLRSWPRDDIMVYVL